MNLPQELIDKIIDRVWDADDSPSHATTKMASLISRAWVNRSQRYIFYSVKFDPSGDRFGRWCNTVIPGPNGVSRHVRSLTIQATRPDGWWINEGAIERALPYFDSFRNVQALQVLDWNVAPFPPEMLARCFTPFAKGIRLLRWDPYQDTTHEMWTRIVELFPLVDQILFYPNFFLWAPLPFATPTRTVRKLVFFGSYAANYPIVCNLRFQEIHIGCNLGMPLETLITIINRHAGRLEILSIFGISRVTNPSNAGTLGSVLGGCHVLRELSLYWAPTDEASEPYLIDAIPGDCIQLLRIMPSRVLWEHLWMGHLSDTTIPRLKAAHEKLAQAIRQLGMRFSSKNRGRKISVWFVIPRVPYIMRGLIKDSVIALWEAVEGIVSFGFEMTETELQNIDKRCSIPGLEA